MPFLLLEHEDKSKSKSADVLHGLLRLFLIFGSGVLMFGLIAVSLLIYHEGRKVDYTHFSAPIDPIITGTIRSDP